MSHIRRGKRIYTRASLERELRDLSRLETEGFTGEENAFLDGAYFALKWFTNQRRTTPSKAVAQWRLRGDPYDSSFELRLADKRMRAEMLALAEKWKKAR